MGRGVSHRERLGEAEPEFYFDCETVELPTKLVAHLSLFLADAQLGDVDLGLIGT